MKRLLVAGVGVLILSACGSGGGSVVSANSTGSTEITAVGTIVGNVNANAAGDNSATANAAALATDNATISQDVTSANAADDVAPVGNDSGE